jgi:hypothetical protein
VAHLSNLANVNGDEVQIIAAPHNPWEQVFDILARNGLSIRTPLNLAISVTSNWIRPNEEWIGVVIDYEVGQVGGNPLVDYSPRIRSPERSGHVPFDKPLILLEKPQGNLASVGEDRIFSSDLIDALGGQACGKTGGPVILAGKEMANWKRFEPTQRCAIIDSISIQAQMPCAICGAPHHPLLGVWVGKVDEAYIGPVAVDELGSDHYGMTHPFVVPWSLVVEINKRFRGKG